MNLRVGLSTPVSGEVCYRISQLSALCAFNFEPLDFFTYNLIKIAVFSEVLQCRLIELTDVSEEHIASIIKVEK